MRFKNLTEKWFAQIYRPHKCHYQINIVTAGIENVSNEPFAKWFWHAILESYTKVLMIIYWHLNATKRHKMRLILMTIFRDKSLWLFLNTLPFWSSKTKHRKQFAQRHCISTPSVPHIIALYKINRGVFHQRIFVSKGNIWICIIWIYVFR